MCFCNIRFRRNRRVLSYVDNKSHFQNNFFWNRLLFVVLNCREFVSIIDDIIDSTVFCFTFVNANKICYCCCSFLLIVDVDKSIDIQIDTLIDNLLTTFVDMQADKLIENSLIVFVDKSIDKLIVDKTVIELIAVHTTTIDIFAFDIKIADQMFVVEKCLDIDQRVLIEN